MEHGTRPQTGVGWGRIFLVGGAEGWRANSCQRSVFMCERECKRKSRGNSWNTEKRGEGQRIWDAVCEKWLEVSWAVQGHSEPLSEVWGLINKSSGDCWRIPSWSGGTDGEGYRVWFTFGVMVLTRLEVRVATEDLAWDKWDVQRGEHFGRHASDLCSGAGHSSNH